MKFGFSELLVILFLVVIGTFHFSRAENLPLARTEEAIPVVDTFRDLDLEARGIFVYDLLLKKPLYEKMADTPLPLASLTKLVTVITAADILPKNAIVTIARKHLKEEGDQGLFADEKWNLKNIFDFSLVSSSNDGIAAIVDTARAVISSVDSNANGARSFVDFMNEKSKKLGLTPMRVINETGLDVESFYQNGGHGSSRDVAMLMTWIVENEPELLEATPYKRLTLVSESQKVHNIQNTNEIIGHIPSLIGSKTGYTDRAGGNLVIVFDMGFAHPIVVSVLGSSIEGRFSDAEKLIAATFL